MCVCVLSHLFAEKEVLAFIPVFEKGFKFLKSGGKRRSKKLLFKLLLYYQGKTNNRSVRLNSGKYKCRKE